MIKIVTLGTAGSTPTKARGLPSIAIVHDGDVYLFDCGEGTQMQMMRFGLNISKVKAIFVSHIHGDHVIGIAGLLRTMALNNRKDGIDIYVPQGAKRPIQSLIFFDKAIIRFPIAIKEIKAGNVYKKEDFEISAFKVEHSVLAYGYLFRERDRLRFIKDRCRAAGLKNTMFSELAKKGSLRIGKKDVRLKDVTYMQKGASVAYATDTRPSVSTVNAAMNCDILIHEANFMESEAQKAMDRKHSTAKEAAGVAKKAKVKKLILTHISARYRNTKEMLKEARSVFANTEIAQDGSAFYLGKGGIV